MRRRARLRPWPRPSASLPGRPDHGSVHRGSPSPDTDVGTERSGGIGAGTTTASHVTVSGNIGFDLPDGYEVEQQADGFVQVFGDGGYFFAIVTPPPTDMKTMITDHLDGLQSLGIQDLQVSDPEEVQIPTLVGRAVRCCSASRAPWRPSRTARWP